MTDSDRKADLLHYLQDARGALLWRSITISCHSENSRNSRQHGQYARPRRPRFWNGQLPPVW